MWYTFGKLSVWIDLPMTWVLFGIVKRIIVTHMYFARLRHVTVIIVSVTFLYFSTLNVVFVVDRYVAGFLLFIPAYFHSSPLVLVHHLFDTLLSAHRLGFSAVEEIYRPFATPVAIVLRISPHFLSIVHDLPWRKTIFKFFILLNVVH